jgi:hypothetical protein
MRRALAIAALLLVTQYAASGQTLTVLHIKITVVDATGTVTPVPRHPLHISDNPPTAAPRRIFTRADGTADVRLRPGNYTVESDQPFTFLGNAYEWRRTLDVAPAGDASLELTAADAEVAPITGAEASAAPDLSALLVQWQGSVVAIWTPTAHASGFVVGANGIIATNQRAVGTATSVEVQLTPTVKVAGSVLAADAMRDVAILRVDPLAVASVRPVPLGCPRPEAPAIAKGQEIIALGTSLRRPRETAFGDITRVEANGIVSDLTLATGSAGGPVFTAGGEVIGMTSDGGAPDQRRIADARIVRIADVCAVVAAAETNMSSVPLPSGAHLPVEPQRPFPEDALRDAVQRRAGSLNPQQMSVSDFDVSFITPVNNYAAKSKSDFSNWTEYVDDIPPVLLVRVTPRMVEGFWAKVARGAAQTQGVALPPIKRFRSGFLRMRAFCGTAEVTPIHPFKLERRVNETDAIYEGLYVFDPDALGPACGTVRLAVVSEKEPAKEDSKAVDPTVVAQIWREFEPYRALK